WSDNNANATRTDLNVTGPINVTANFERDVYTVHYETNGGLPVPPDQTVVKNNFASGPNSLPLLTGHTFGGWYSDQALTTPFIFAGMPITQNTTLYAKWFPQPFMLIYTAGANGTITGVSPQTVTHGSNGTSVTAVADTGYRFVQWSDNNANATRTDLNVTGPINVTANFERDVYTVHYETNGGLPVPPDQTVVKNNFASGPNSLPLLTGHTFGGWYSDQALTTPFIFAGMPITQNTTLYAKWIPIPYTLTYTAGTNGTISGASPQTVNYCGNGSPVTAVANTGYAFVKWSDDNTNATRTDSNVTGPINVSAIFAGNVYVVSFESNGGDAVSNKSVPYNGYAIAPQPPTLSGYAFEDWYTDTGLNNRFDFAAMPITGNINLYAKWTMLPPGAPALQSAIPGDGTVTIQWTSIEGADDYQVFMSSTSGHYDPQSAISVTNSVYSYQAAGLTNGIPYYFIVKAVNEVGAIASNEASATPRTFPAAPANVTATAGNSSATISFTAPTNNGGSPITEYRVTASPGNITVTGTSTSITVSGLTNGTKYTFTVEAKNAAGYGPLSFVSNEVTPTAPANNGGVGGGGGGAQNTTNTSDGKLTIPAGSGGETKLGDEITVTVPAGASDKELKLTVEQVTDTSKLNPNGEVLAGPVFDLKGNVEDGFKKPIEITLKYDPALVPEGQHASVHFFDEKTKTWVEIGGKASGSTITADVSKTGKYAVLVVGKEPTVVDPTNTFSDIAGHWAEANIKQAVQQGIVQGYTDGTFKPNAIVTRAEFAVMLINALKPVGNGAELSFADNAKIGAWAQKAVAQAVQASIIKGFSDGTFRPDAPLTRAEMASIVANALMLVAEKGIATEFSDDKSIPNWAKGAIAELIKLGVMQGKNGNKFDANATTTRAEAVTVLLKMLAQASK
ncbi:InlB B-repeat-containing protein, partial [Cohnella sp. WQ 127256]|uniref:InlB B-repeat-containing protein n=1 Tax=Cohnella sp. WQ 127256 TaxID=2938790 RepID=UPI00211988DA